MGLAAVLTRSPSLKVLFLTPFSPVPPDFGGALRVFHILRQLARRHAVTVVGYGAPEDALRLQKDIPEVKAVHFLPHPWVARHRRVGQLLSTFSRHSFFQLSVVSAPLQRTVEQLLTRETFDVVHTEFSHLGPLRLPQGPRRVLDTHNVEYDNFRRMWETTRAPLRKLHYLLEYQKMRRDELSLCRQQDVLLTTSERDLALFEPDVPRVPKHVVPNGVDTAYFTPAPGVVPEPHSLVFTGMMAYVPNYDGMGWFLDDVFPRILERVPDAKLYVVGKSPPAHLVARSSANVIITGTVPDVRPYVHRASVYVVPLRMGGGTRLKIAEALAMKKPLVSTRIGAEGIDLVDGESVRFADTKDAFAQRVLELLDDVSAQHRLADAGHALVKQRYDWDVIGEKLAQVYRDLA